MKKLLLSIIVMSLSILVIGTSFWGGVKTVDANTQTLTMDKTVLLPSETTNFRYTGASSSGKDWVGIYRRGEIPASGTSAPKSIFYVYLTEGSGVVDFLESEVATQGTAKGTIQSKPLSVGLYTVYYCLNDGYTVAASVDFEVVAESNTQQPKSITYSPYKAGSGFADGEIKITPPDITTDISSYKLYWGNAHGKLEGYTAIGSVSANGSTDVTYTVTANTIIPSAATCVLAFSVKKGAESTTSAKFDLPDNIVRDFDNPLYSFAAISDIHIDDDDKPEYSPRYDAALKDIKAVAPNAIHIAVVGDITNDGEVKQYQRAKEIETANGVLPKMYYATGNHDLRGAGGWSGQVARFNEQLEMNAPYYEVVSEGTAFLFMGSQVTENPHNLAEIWEDQRDWLAERLEYYSKSKQIFVFLHEPLENTTAGSSTAQDWYDIKEDDEVRAIIDSYPQVIMFTGHTHWHLESQNTMFDGQGTKASKFNTASVAYLWQGDWDSTESLVYTDTNSQGYIVEVYGDTVLVRGRDFENNLWISAAQFAVDLTPQISKMINDIDTADSGLIAKEAELNALIADTANYSAYNKNVLQDEIELLQSLALRVTTLKQVEAVKLLINNLPDTITKDNKDQVTQAKAAYNALNAEQKQLLGSAYLSKLNNAVSAADKINNGSGNLALILGITIPCSVVVILGGASILYIKKRQGQRDVAS